MVHQRSLDREENKVIFLEHVGTSEKLAIIFIKVFDGVKFNR